MQEELIFDYSLPEIERALDCKVVSPIACPFAINLEESLLDARYQFKRQSLAAARQNAVVDLGVMKWWTFARATILVILRHRLTRKRLCKAERKSATSPRREGGGSGRVPHWRWWEGASTYLTVYRSIDRESVCHVWSVRMANAGCRTIRIGR
jgi:hypothetical protein